LHASHLRKPQLNFKQPPNNYAEGPWRSTLKHKYNAQVPLGYIIDAEDEESPHDLYVLNSRFKRSFSHLHSSLHPYRFEITNIQYPSHMFENPTPVPPESFEHTPFAWVATVDDFNSMLQELREAQEIAVDLEHHDYRTYIGFVCLMQVSTRHKDWIVDTLVLREELEELNEVFTDPRIVKASSTLFVHCRLP
jgi:exosome complex exonuclease RRP6